MFNNQTTNAKAHIHLLFGILLTIGLSGCALIPDENGKSISQIQPEDIHLADDIKLARDGWPSAQWWRAYGDVQLNTLIEQAFNDAPTLAAAQVKLEKSRAQVDLARAALGVQIAANGSISRERLPIQSVSSIIGIGPWFTTGKVGIGAGYEVDIWGKNRQQVDAAIGVENAQLAEQATAELEISAAVAQIYYQIQTALHTLDLLQETHEIVAETVAANAARESRGLTPKTLTEQSRSELLSVERQITSVKTAARELREALRALVGAQSDNLPEINKVALPTMLSGLPDTLSYDLLSRRPDLQTMRWYIEATNSQIEVAKAAFYPSFDIKALFGLSSLFIDDLFKYENRAIVLSPGFTLPIFTSGALSANLQSVRADNRLMIAQYNQAVLNAVRDVAVAGTKLEGLEQEEQLQLEKLEAVTVAKKSAEAHYQEGLASKITAIQASLPVNAEEISLLSVRSNLIIQSIALIKALGGGYQAKSEEEHKIN